MTSFVKKKNAQERCCWNCNIWPNWFTSYQSQYWLNYNSIPEFVGKSLMFTVKYLKQHKIFEISLSESQIFKEWHMTSFVEKKNARKRCCWNCNIWPNWFTSYQSQYWLNYNSIPEFVGKSLMFTVKYLKQHKIFEISLSQSQIFKEWQTSTIIWEISDSNPEAGRNGSKSGVSRIIWESW